MGLFEKVADAFRRITGRRRYPVHEDCSFCHERTYLPFRCPYCNRYFCERHRLPFNHDCTHIREWKNRPATPAPSTESKDGSIIVKK